MDASRRTKNSRWRQRCEAFWVDNISIVGQRFTKPSPCPCTTDIDSQCSLEIGAAWRFSPDGQPIGNPRTAATIR